MHPFAPCSEERKLEGAEIAAFGRGGYLRPGFPEVDCFALQQFSRKGKGGG